MKTALSYDFVSCFDRRVSGFKGPRCILCNKSIDKGDEVSSVGDKYFLLHCSRFSPSLLSVSLTRLLVVTLQAWSKHLKDDCAPNKARLQQQQGKQYFLFCYYVRMVCISLVGLLESREPGLLNGRS